jgi:hypothetical protein
MDTVTILIVCSCVAGIFFSYLIVREILLISSFRSSFDSAYPEESDIVVENGKTEEEKLSQDWQRVCEDFSRAWEKVISEKAKRGAE